MKLVIELVWTRDECAVNVSDHPGCPRTAHFFEWACVLVYSFEAIEHGDSPNEAFFIWNLLLFRNLFTLAVRWQIVRERERL